jgi:hypothetical protein
MWKRTLVAALLLLALPATIGVVAQPKRQETGHPNAGARGAPTAGELATAAAAPQFAVSIEQALYLIRSTLLTLNDANRSGNYTVLRDLAAPDFQARNTAADLAQSFSELRHRNFDLYAAALLAPQLSAPPVVDANQRLRLTGLFPTRPLQINFDLLFQVIAGQWRLMAISVATPEAPPAAQARAPSNAATTVKSKTQKQGVPAPKQP